MTKEVEVGDEFAGKVVKTTTFGAFVELAKGTDGLLHISNVVARPAGRDGRGRPQQGRRDRGARGRGRPRARPHRPAPGRRPGRSPARRAEELAGVGTGGRSAAAAPRPRRPRPRRATASATAATAAPDAAHRAGPAAIRSVASADRGGRPAARERRADGSRGAVEARRPPADRAATRACGSSPSAMPSVRSVGARLLDRHRLARRGPSPRPASRTSSSTCCSGAPTRYALAGDRPALRRDGRRAQRRHRQGDDVGLRARARPRTSPRAFDVMADMVWRPAFAATIDAEREVVLEEIAMYEDDPQDKVFDVLGEAVFGDHPLGRRDHRRAPTSSAPPGPTRCARSTPTRYVPAQRRDRGGRLGRPRRARRAGAWPPAPSAPATASRRRLRAGARRARRTRALRAQGHRAVPRLPRRARARARRRAPLRAARARHDLRRHVLVAPVPGGARAARAGLLRSTRSSAVRGHRPDRPVPRHATRQRRPRRWASSATSSSASADEPATAEELDRAKENVKGRVVLGAGVDGRAHEPPRRVGARRACRCCRSTSVVERIDAVTLEDLAALAARAAGARAPERGRHRRRRGRVPRRARAAVGGAGVSDAARGVIRVAVAGAAGRDGPGGLRAPSRAPRTWSWPAGPTRAGRRAGRRARRRRRRRRLHARPTRALDERARVRRGRRARRDRDHRLRPRASCERRGPAPTSSSPRTSRSARC